MSSSRGMKNLFFIILLIGAAAAGFGYFKQSSSLREGGDANATTPAAQAAVQPKKPPLPPSSNPIFSPRPGDIVEGQVNAPVTIVEYASLSCPHCAHFFKEVLPEVKKEFIDNGQAKLVFRHFPLNAQALRGGQLVECADADQRQNFVRVLFEMQEKWAYTPDFLANLKQIALVGGIDAAHFDSCMADKKLENRVLASRQEAVAVLGVNSTPTFFVNGSEIEGDASIDAFRTAMKNVKPAAASPKQ